MSIPAEVTNLVKQLDPADVVILSGLAVTALQGLIKRYKEFGKVVNVTLSFVLPLGGAVLATLVADGSVLAHYPQVYVVAQGVYQAVNALKKSAVMKELQSSLPPADSQNPPAF